jgi:hypothetical protein
VFDPAREIGAGVRNFLLGALDLHSARPLEVAAELAASAVPAAVS